MTDIDALITAIRDKDKKPLTVLPAHYLDELKEPMRVKDFIARYPGPKMFGRLRSILKAHQNEIIDNDIYRKLWYTRNFGKHVLTEFQHLIEYGEPEDIALPADGGLAV